MASMPWGEEQERLTEEARLSVASPEDVVRELKRVAQKSRGELRGRKALEALLVERNDRLINLGLACYGTSDEVFQALYKHGLEKPADVADERYRRGLRIGCLSNRTVAHWIGDFPRRLIGPEEIQRIVAAGDDREAEALICNPSISDRLFWKSCTSALVLSLLLQMSVGPRWFISRAEMSVWSRMKTMMLRPTWAIIEFITQSSGCSKLLLSIRIGCTFYTACWIN
jgi:hypothetical protein